MTSRSTSRYRAGRALFLLASCLVLLPEWAGAAAAQVSGPIKVWVTTGDRSKLLSREADLDFASTDVASGSPSVIAIEPAIRYQEMIGFGAALTDASSWLLRKRLSAQQRAALMQEMFSRTTGLGLSFTRLSIGASDFSLHHYSLDDVAAGQVADPQLANFSITPNRDYLLPAIKEALAINPDLRIMASPWSAPAWMKTTGSMLQGSLRPDAYGAFAQYLKRYLDAYQAEGIPIYALTIANEPFYGPKDYPGMLLGSAQRAELIGAYIGPLLAKSHPETKILDWDHNWSHPESPMAVLSDPTAARYINGVAWHCYEGSADAQSLVHDRFPEKDAYFSECTGGGWSSDWSEVLQYQFGSVIIGATRAWARGVVLWNLVLDEKGGPHDGGCSECRGVVTIDSRSGALTRNAEYYALAHASKFVRPGARRIASNSVTGGIQTVAFRNADDASIVLLVANPAVKAQAFSVSISGRSFSYALPPRSVATLTWGGR